MNDSTVSVFRRGDRDYGCSDLCEGAETACTTYSYGRDNKTGFERFVTVLAFLFVFVLNVPPSEPKILATPLSGIIILVYNLLKILTDFTQISTIVDFEHLLRNFANLQIPS